MEQQSWSVENKLTFREYLQFKLLYPKKKLLSLFCFLIAPCIYLYLASPNFFGMGPIIFLSAFLALGITLAAPCIEFSLIKKTFPVQLEVSSLGITTSAAHLGFSSSIQWPTIYRITRKCGLIFIDHKIVAKATLIIPLRIFKDQAEGERFYADLNYFWEQGR